MKSEKKNTNKKTLKSEATTKKHEYTVQSIKHTHMMLEHVLCAHLHKMLAHFYTFSIDLDINQLKSSNHSVKHNLCLRSVALGGFYSEGMKFMTSIVCQMSLAPVSPNHSHTVIFTCKCKCNAPTVEPCPSLVRSRITCT